LSPVLWQKNFHRVVNCDDAQNISGLVYDWKCKQVVLGDSLGNIPGRFIYARYRQRF